MASRASLARQVGELLYLASVQTVPKATLVCGDDWVVRIVSRSEAEINRQPLNPTATELRALAEEALRTHGYTIYGLGEEPKKRLSA